MSNTENLGNFVYNDAASNVVVEVRDADGALYDFTGATDIELPCRRLDGRETLTVTGSILGVGTDGTILFEGLAAEVEQPKPNAVNTYRAIPRWKPAGETEFHYLKTELRFSVELFP